MVISSQACKNTGRFNDYPAGVGRNSEVRDNSIIANKKE